MPRYEFETKSEFESWGTKHLEPKKYEIVYTNTGDVVAVPVKSTRPIIYGYINLYKKETAKTFAENLQKKFSVDVFCLSKYVWSTEREPQTE